MHTPRSSIICFLSRSPHRETVISSSITLSRRRLLPRPIRQRIRHCLRRWVRLLHQPLRPPRRIQAPHQRRARPVSRLWTQLMTQPPTQRVIRLPARLTTRQLTTPLPIHHLIRLVIRLEIQPSIRRVSLRFTRPRQLPTRPRIRPSTQRAIRVLNRQQIPQQTQL